VLDANGTNTENVTPDFHSHKTALLSDTEHNDVMYFGKYVKVKVRLSLCLSTMP